MGVLLGYILTLNFTTWLRLKELDASPHVKVLNISTLLSMKTKLIIFCLNQVVTSPPRAQITFNALQNDSLNVVLARLICLDRLSFNQIALSSDIRAGIRARLKESNSTELVPTGPNKIRNHVMQYARNTKNVLKMVC